jgi:hypothetical protein
MKDVRNNRNKRIILYVFILDYKEEYLKRAPLAALNYVFFNNDREV